MKFCIQSRCHLRELGSPKRLGARAALALGRSGGWIEPLPQMQGTSYALAAGELVWLGNALPSAHPRMILFNDIGSMRTQANTQNCGVDDPITRALSRRTSSLCDAVRAGKLNKIESTAQALLGLGYGLTPSGDDLVGALLFGLHACGLRVEGFCERLVAHAATKTNAISATLFADLARGESFEVMHHLAQAYRSHASASKTAPLEQTLLSIGHHSGSDLLAGLRMAMFDFPSHA